MSTHLQPLTELPHAMLARDWDLHVERAGTRFGRQASGEPHEPLWVASVSRGDFALEAQGRTPAAALEKLWDGVVEHSRTAATTRRARA